MIKKKTFKTLDELKDHIKSHFPTFYFSSQTSTVIPYDHLEELFDVKNKEFYLGDLSELPKEMKLLKNENIFIKGPVNWKEAREYLQAQGRNIMTAPTEELALITAGVATSCTGERCFSMGTMRSQIVKLKYLNHNGDEVELNCDKPFPKIDGLKNYQNIYKEYQDFKNAPFPRFEVETDLMTGTEGQLGVVTELELKTVPNFPVTHLFILAPKWEENFKPHLEIFEKVQKLRNEVIICEHLDSNSINYLKEEDRIGNNQDVIFLEVKNDHFEEVFEKLISELTLTNEDQIFEIPSAKFHQIRAGVPRAVFEANSKAGVKKMGTDVQVRPKDFEKLIDIYRSFTKIGIGYNLFGHFGDAHLHFNFMPTPKDIDKCKKEFEALYKEVLKMKGSPFAEHGIGLLKQPYIKEFYNNDIKKVFLKLKKEYDPEGQFFPQGFMNL